MTTPTTSSSTMVSMAGLRRCLSQMSMLAFKASTSGEEAWAHTWARFRQSRFNARRIRKRVVFKHGDCNVIQGNVAKRRRKYLQDIFTTLVDAQWRWTLLVFAMNFFLSWLMFAIVWWLIVFTHGDLSEEHINGTDPWVPCITNIRGFTSCFLFSIETQHTIGYGGRTTTEECPEAIFVMCIQSITGVMIQAFMVGVVFAKLSRPKKRTQTLMFSRNAVINHRDGVPCLMFRVGDMRKSHIIEAHVRAQLIKHKVTREGENLPFFQTELKVSGKVGGDGEEDKIFFIWPTTIVHKIDCNSPLYNMSANNLLRERFEIVVILGDANAKVGKEEIYKNITGGESKHDINNNNGLRLINLAIEKDMKIMSTHFKRKDIHKGTWIITGTTKINQIDHFLIAERNTEG
ncbi:unnamed protein product [Psylliodes chrysocephalus]|uniref:Uncharacterized protein n=1 Tax=Psylliodes chrysocephalus TaxID=3402493 RepID=A0A9P0GAL8_9CUCU|nr:unnamed protein product [Psylliodes chrysocephala]